MALAIVDKIPRMEVAGLQVSDALKGLVAGGVGDGIGLLVSRYVPVGVPPVLVKLGIAAVPQIKFVKDFLGKDAANIGSLFLLASAIQSAWNVRHQISTMVVALVPATAAQKAAEKAAAIAAAQAIMDQATAMAGIGSGDEVELIGNSPPLMPITFAKEKQTLI